MSQPIGRPPRFARVLDAFGSRPLQPSAIWPRTVGGLSPAAGRAWRPVAVLAAGLIFSAGLGGLGVTAQTTAPETFTNFETEPVRPLALAPNGRHLFALNTADDRLEVWAVTPGGLEPRGEVIVGLRPVALVARTDTEVWVSNHLSDAVSVVDVSDPSAPRLVRTFSVGDEPRDIVAAGPDRRWVMVATASRPPLNLALYSQAAVWVFDSQDLAKPPYALLLSGLKPRGLAVSPDGRLAFAAILHSGNRTATLDERTIRSATPPSSTGTPVAASRPTGHGRLAGGRPVGRNLATAVARATEVAAEREAPYLLLGALGRQGPRQDPTATLEPLPPPPVSRILRQEPGGRWLDSTGRDWTKQMSFDLPDSDVFVIDTAELPRLGPAGMSGVGTVLFNLAVQPRTGEVWVTNTEARNTTRFEPALKGKAVLSRLTRLIPQMPAGALTQTYAVRPLDLNSHLASGTMSRDQALPLSFSQPTDLVFAADGSAYLAVFGSNKVAVLDPEGQVVDRIAVGAGPGGLVLDEAGGRLYVLNHLDATISIVDLIDHTVSSVRLQHDPVPAVVREGQPFLYDAARSGGFGDQSCASCHVFGDLDGLAWDLGNPQGTMLAMPFELTHENFLLKPRDFVFHPEKGPMMTQSFRGLAGTGPLHWRGDRFTPEGQAPTDLGNFHAFRPAFRDLLGRPEPISDEDMDRFGRFVLTMRYPPNPYERLDRRLDPNQEAGLELYRGSFDIDSGITNCAGCHTLPLGTNGLINFEGDRSGQDFKAPHFRNLYEKMGRSNSAGKRLTGFGFSHDGSSDDIVSLLQTELFTFPNDQPNQPDLAARTEVAEYLIAFDTGMAPAVGRQMTFFKPPTGDELARLAALLERAKAGDCELVAHGRYGAVNRGWLLGGTVFVPDRAQQPSVSQDVLLAGLQKLGQELTFLCVPPGEGRRTALDRDLDTHLNGDEIAAGSDPASAASVPGFIPTATATTAPPVRTPGPRPVRPTDTPSPAVPSPSPTATPTPTGSARVTPGTGTHRLYVPWLNQPLPLSSTIRASSRIPSGHLSFFDRPLE